MKYTEEELIKMHRLATEIMTKIHKEDNSGKLLYLFCRKLYALSKLKAYSTGNEHKFVVISEDEYKKLKDSEYMEESMIRAANEAGVKKEKLFDIWYKNGLLGVYNLGMEHMYNYLKGDLI